MKQKQKIIYIVIFFAAVLLPTVLTIFGFKSANYENRQLAESPVLLGDEGLNLEFTQDFDTYFADNFALRPYFVTAYSKILKTVFETSAVPNVVVGKRDSLFLTATVYDYQGQIVVSDEELAAICERLKSIQDEYEAKGIAFFFVSAPNKNTIYPEDMPDRYVPNTAPSNYDRLYEMMDAYGIHSVYLKDVLVDAKEVEQVYYNDDSHWNNFGAVVAYTEMMDKTAELIPDFTYVDFLSIPYKIENTMHGGTTQMLYPSSDKKDMDMTYDFKKTFTSDRAIVDSYAVHLETLNENYATRALIFRDSFFNAQVKFFSESFGYIKYTRSIPYDFSLAEEADVDIVILEIVERNIHRLLENLD
ncbi:MAG: hypothetical protein AB1Z19_07655 [Eubacteriales bacterium]